MYIRDSVGLGGVPIGRTEPPGEHHGPPSYCGMVGGSEE